MPLVGVVVGVDEERSMNIHGVLPTGSVARLLGIPEPRIQDALRRNPDLAPPKERGRRRWRRRHVERLAAHFEIDLDDTSKESA